MALFVSNDEFEMKRCPVGLVRTGQRVRYGVTLDRALALGTKGQKMSSKNYIWLLETIILEIVLDRSSVDGARFNRNLA